MIYILFLASTMIQLGDPQCILTSVMIGPEHIASQIYK